MREGNRRRISTTLVMSLVGVAVLSRPAYAYLDPGTGSVVLQLLLAGVAGVAAVMKLYWAQIVRFVRGRKDPGISDVRRETTASHNKRES